MLRFEAALAVATGRAGLIPLKASQAIAAACHLNGIDVDAIQRDTPLAGTPAIPLVRQLTQRIPEDARGFVHWGATSQDVVDTALVMQMKDGLEVLLDELRAIGAESARLARKHRRTLMPGRTLLQQATPITFGLKAARWLAAVTRQIVVLQEVRRGALVLQFGGAAGTLAALGDRGDKVTAKLASELGLRVPDLPWHAERDRPATVVTTLGVVAGLMSKIASDIAHLAQTEVGEVAEGEAPGKGGSSAMPQKRNPVDAIAAIAAARLAIGTVPVVLFGMAQEHERGAGGWQAEWTAIPDAFRHGVRAAFHVRAALEALEIDVARMRANLEQSGGAVMAESLAVAMAPHVGRPEAQRLVAQLAHTAVHDGITLAELARSDERVTSALKGRALDRALDPGAYLGQAATLVDRALAVWQRAESRHAKA